MATQTVTLSTQTVTLSTHWPPCCWLIFIFRVCKVGHLPQSLRKAKIISYLHFAQWMGIFQTLFSSFLVFDSVDASSLLEICFFSEIFHSVSMQSLPSSLSKLTCSFPLRTSLCFHSLVSGLPSSAISLLFCTLFMFSLDNIIHHLFSTC